MPTDHGRAARRRLTLALVAALTAAALVGVGIGVTVWARSGCAGGPTDRAHSADMSRIDPYPNSAEPENAVARYLGTVGVEVVPRWGLREGLPLTQSGPTAGRELDVPAVAVAGELVVTVQRFESGPDATVLAAYDARTGATRWQVEGPALSGTPALLPGAPGQMLLLGAGAEARVSALDLSTGAIAWCTGAGPADATATVVAAGPERVVLSSQHGSGSTLRALDPASGEELWQVEFESHDATLAPALAGDVVLVYAVPDGGAESELQAFDVASGARRWTAPTSVPGDLAGGATTTVVASGYGNDRVDAFDPRTGQPTWTFGVGTSGRAGLHVLDEGVLVTVDRGLQPGDLVLLDPAAGVPRWTAAGVSELWYASEPLVLDGPARLLTWSPDQFAVVDVATGGVTATGTDGESVLAAGPSGEVVVTRRGDRVSVLTAPR